MREITITLTDEQERFLKDFALKQCDGSKDNLCTHHPLHLVQTSVEVVVNPDYDEPDKVLYCVPDWSEQQYYSPQELIKAYYEDNDCPIPIISFEEAYDADEFIDVNGDEQVIVDESDYFEAYGINEKFFYKVHVGYRYRTEAVFFILDEAKRYIEYQGHNLRSPRTYTIGAGYANKGEYHHFWQLLFDIGKKLNSLAKKVDK